MKRFLIALCALIPFAGPAAAETVSDVVDQSMSDVYVLGEIHDNPAHHLVQAAIIDRVAPAAVVFEMLTTAQAETIAASLAQTGEIDPDAIGWAESGWPDFEIYAPVFASAKTATIAGAAVPRDQVMGIMDLGLEGSFAGDAARFGLTDALPSEQLEARLALQAAAHCNAMPEDMLPFMVSVQRLRDAELARVALAMLDGVGGPVVVITGNGHARPDWGVPALLNVARPDLTVFSLGQTEDEADMTGGYDLVLTAPAVDRPDPCLAFE